MLHAALMFLSTVILGQTNHFKNVNDLVYSLYLYNLPQVNVADSEVFFFK